MFKGPSDDIDAIYTAPTSAVCGVTLEKNGKEYLITGTTFTKIQIPHYKIYQILFFEESLFYVI